MSTPFVRGSCAACAVRRGLGDVVAPLEGFCDERPELGACDVDAAPADEGDVVPTDDDDDAGADVDRAPVVAVLGRAWAVLRCVTGGVDERCTGPAPATPPPLTDGSLPSGLCDVPLESDVDDAPVGADAPEVGADDGALVGAVGVGAGMVGGVLGGATRAGGWATGGR